MIRLSVVIITFNEAVNIGKCLASVKDIADEIIVIDSSSTDDTVHIAQSHGAMVITHPFLGYGAQKNFATGCAGNNWVLSLDADEALTPQLRQSILKVKQQPDYDVYDIPRLTNYCGQWIHHSGWYPDHQTRLYDRTKGRWIERKVHEYWNLDTPGKKGLLKGDLLHYSFTSISAHLQKIEKYTDLAAQEAARNNKNPSLLIIFFSPFWHFINEYFLRLGFLDGFYGYVICKLSAYSAFCKIIKTRMYYKLNRE